MFTSRYLKHFGTGNLAILMTSFLWGIGVVVVKSAIGETPETFRIFVFNGLRLPLVSLMLFITAIIQGRTITIHREHLPRVAAVAFSGMFLNTVTGIVGLNLSSASNMGIINSTTSLFILLVSFVTGIERPTPKLVASVYQIPFFLYQLREQTWSAISPVNWLNFSIGAFGSFFAANVLFFFA